MLLLTRFPGPGRRPPRRGVYGYLRRSGSGSLLQGLGARGATRRPVIQQREDFHHPLVPGFAVVGLPEHSDGYLGVVGDVEGCLGLTFGISIFFFSL